MTHISSTPEPPAGPVPFSSRIGAMDIARGFALLGIFVMNIGAFSDPASDYMTPADPATASAAEVWWHVITHGLFESKFYSLFSLLFGMGFIILTDRVQARRSSPTAVALRRFGFLALLGLIHAHLLWFGDILFIYACCSVALLLCRTLRAKTLLILGGSLTLAGDILILLMTLLGVFFGSGQPAPESASATPPAIAAPADTASADTPSSDSASPDPEADLAAARARAAESRDAALARQSSDDPDASSTTPPDTTPSTTEHPAPSTSPPSTSTPTEPLRGWAFIKHSFMSSNGGSPTQTDAWRDAETAAYRDGPWKDLAAFRSVTWAFILVFVLFGGAPRIMGLFLLGAGLIRSDFFSPTHHRLHTILLTLALTVGAPVALFTAYQQTHAFPHDGSNFPPIYVLWQALHQFGAILIPFGMLSAAALLATRAARTPSGPLAKALHPLACTGRMGLTNYLFQTLAATTLCYFYGFALFGTLDPIEKALVVLTTYAAQLLISTLWFRAFAIGPVEWLWRSFTYLHAPRFRRAKPE